jgi:molybdopterin synthase catalytic subunit
MNYLTRKPIDLNLLMMDVADPKAGAIVTFLGTIRNHSEGKDVKYLEYEAYETMAEKMIDTLVKQAYVKYPVHHIALKHRLGRIELTEPSIAIYVSSSHRADAYSASRFLIDEIKKKVPIWKKEYFTDGSEWSPGAPVTL